MSIEALLWLEFSREQLREDDGGNAGRHEGKGRGRTVTLRPDLANSVSDKRRNNALPTKKVLFQRDRTERLHVSDSPEPGDVCSPQSNDKPKRGRPRSRR